MENYSLLEGKDIYEISRILTDLYKNKKNNSYLCPLLNIEELNEYYTRMLVFEYKNVYYSIGNDIESLIGFTLNLNPKSTNTFVTLRCISLCKDEFIYVIKNIFLDFSSLFEQYKKIICYVNEEDSEMIGYLEKLGFVKEIFLPNELEINKNVLIYSYFFN
ncbi:MULTISPECIES: hypothetical protein [Clostridium]|uniref:Uncharacterized protein n=1 Tax=Clostridium sporogenes TaxID=1509 RepID=A0A7U4JM80_CLOSG|nr:hypothetical protein [Clostridium sporogenes]AVP59856.1 hypothetical protein C7M79_03715 [Clostridium botulinum]AKC61725.1 hypothetical protein CLSPO_c10050 [Clostridium sporogenes]AKJ89039.1 hypothetical protein CLSPOx_05095 [Clostridium sporogenes]KCZ69032.1 hypothetical protein CSPO_4c05570 [Clostridium sporogenes]KOY67210.1 hypothetical protein AN649_03955 [Clostridium sporogenes]